MSCAKSFAIPKRMVWRAYLKVKTKGGAAGVDGQTMEDFEIDLKDNLYRIWNRMSSGTYFPPPVVRVEIPKRDGGTRNLGVPTISDRIAQTVVKRWLEPKVDPSFHRNSYGYRPGKSAIVPYPKFGGTVGNMTGCSILTSKPSSIVSIMTS